MNLKFWKKKPRPEEETSGQQDADDKTVAMARSDLDSAQETPSRSRLAAFFSGLGQRFRKSRPAETETVEDSPQHKPDSHSADTDASSEPDSPVKTGIFSRFSTLFSGIRRRFRKAPATGDESQDHPHSGRDHAAAPMEDNPALRSIRRKKRLIIGGAIALAILLLSGIGFATWKIFFSAKGEDAAVANKADVAQGSQAGGHATNEQHDTPENELEALKKKNLELQAQIEAMKKGQSEASATESPGTDESATSPATATNELTISNKDPKGAALTIKEAIEAMNAADGRKPAKKQ